MLSKALISAYRFHRSNPFRAYGDTRRPAEIALAKAREDVAAGKQRYAVSPWSRPVKPVNWAPVEKPTVDGVGSWFNPFPAKRERLAYVENPGSVGLRLVGEVVPECGGRNGWFNSGESSGWFTDPFGDVFRDGTGLVWGVVYQLPARDGKTRFVAGYQFGGTDAGPTLDFGSIFIGDDGNCSDERSAGNPAARDAARVADQMASHAADEEREYQTAYAAGSRYAEYQAELDGARDEFRRLNVERRAFNRQFSSAIVQTSETCKLMRRRLLELADRVQEIREERRTLASGDYEKLSFSPDARLKAAFCEAAGLKSYPA